MGMLFSVVALLCEVFFHKYVILCFIISWVLMDTCEGSRNAPSYAHTLHICMHRQTAIGKFTML